MFLGGNTNPFQTAFVKAGVAGTTGKQRDSDTYGEYYRVVKDLQLHPPVPCTEYLKKLFEDWLCGSPVVLRMKSTDHAKTALEIAIEPFRTASTNVRVDF